MEEEEESLIESSHDHWDNGACFETSNSPSASNTFGRHTPEERVVHPRDSSHPSIITQTDMYIF